MARASLDKVSYVPGDLLRLTFHIPTEELPSYDVTNISTDVLRLALERNQSLIGFGTAPTRTAGNTFAVEVKLPDNAKPGLCVIAHAVITPPEGTTESMSRIQFEPVFFEIRDSSAEPSTAKQLKSKLNVLSQQRAAYSTTVIVTPDATGSTATKGAFRVVIFAVGTLIHARQQLEGYSITPLQGGMTHRHLLNLANAYLSSAQLPHIPFDQDVEQRFESGSPSIVVDYHHVQARNHADALAHCRQHAGLIFLALGRNRGQLPKEFGGVAFDRNSDQTWHFFHAPWYRGNLISDFSAAAVADAVERILPKLQSDPFARLISRSYTEAILEETIDFRLLRLWTILELAADRHVTKNNTPLQHPDGSPILKANGQAETNQSQVGRVYSYLKSLGSMTSAGTYSDASGTHTIIEAGDTSNPNYKPGARVYSLWQMVKAGYAIRNYVAHEGHFDPAAAAAGDQHQQLAAESVNTGRPSVLGFVERAAERVLWTEA